MPSATYSQEHIFESEQKSDFLHIGDWIYDYLPAVNHANYSEIIEWNQKEFYDVKQTPTRPLYPRNFLAHDITQVAEHHSRHERSDEVMERQFNTQQVICSWNQSFETILRKDQYPAITLPLRIEHSVSLQNVETPKHITTSPTTNHEHVCVDQKNSSPTSLQISLSSSSSSTHCSRSSQYSRRHPQSQFARTNQGNASSLETGSQFQVDPYEYDSVNKKDTPHKGHKF